MKNGIKVAALLFVACFIINCGGGGGTSGTSVGPEGGTVTSPDGKLLLTIPANALSSTTQISISPAAATSLPASISDIADANFAYALSPDGLQFATPATVTLRLTQEEAAAYLGYNGALTNQYLITDENGALMYLNNVTTSIDQDTGDYLITGTLSHFSFVTKSDALMSMTITPAGVITSDAADPVDVTVKLDGKKNFKLGAYGQISEVRFKDMELMTIVPDFVTINPATIKVAAGTPVQSASQTFKIGCTGTGDDFMSFWIEKPQLYYLVTSTGTTELTIDKQSTMEFRIICADYAMRDNESAASLLIRPNTGTAAVGEKAGYIVDLLSFGEAEKAVATGTVTDTSIAGTSPQTIDPFPVKKYASTKQDMSFTCYKAGVTLANFQMDIKNMKYMDADFNLRTKNITLNTSVPLTCTETVPAPSGVTVDDTTSCQLNISWTYTDSYMPTGFSIERVKVPSEAWAEIANLADGTKRSYVNSKATDNTLELGATYCYRVRAYKDISGQGRVYSAYSADVGCGTKK